MPKRLLYAIAGITILKLYLAFVYDTGDTGAFALASRLFVQGKDVYNAPGMFLSSPPFNLHVLAVLRVFSTATHIPFEGFWKVPAILADIGFAYLLYSILRKRWNRSEHESTNRTLWYVLNPISVYVSGFHGQFESFWLFCIVLSWYWVTYRKSVIVSAGIAALGVAYKLPAVLLVPGIVLAINRWKNRFLFILVTMILLVLSFLPEGITAPAGIVRQVLRYESTPNVWGISRLLDIALGSHSRVALAIISHLKPAFILALVCLMFFYGRSTRKRFFNFCLLVIALFLILTPGFGVQYIMWPLPFLILTNQRFLKLYTVLAAFAYVNTYGIQLFFFTVPIGFLQRYVFFPAHILYPHDLYFPLWILCFAIVWDEWRVLQKSYRSEKS